MCHQVERERILGLEEFATPEVVEAIEVNLMLARRTNPGARCGGVALNTARLNEAEARGVIAEYAGRLGLPVADPIRGGVAFEGLVEECLRAG
jgi:uncharacterized NAD-dependent epimerase/dehydratase family protein